MALTEIPSELSSTPSIVDNGNSTAITIDASENATFAGNVGIGSSPSTKLHLGGTAPLDSIIRQDSTVSGTNWEIGERAAGKWQIWEDDSDSVVATFMSSGNVGIGNSSGVGKLEVYANNTAPAAYIRQDGTGPIQSWHVAGGAERMRILSTGGITFNGDTAADNALNDYEEGTWTAAIAGMGITTNRAHYTKIGRVVKVDFSLTVTSASASAVAAAITGIPFISSTNADSESAGSVMLLNFTADTNTVSINSYVYSKSANVYMYQTQSNSAAWITVKANDLVVGSAIIGSIIYQTH